MNGVQFKFFDFLIMRIVFILFLFFIVTHSYSQENNLPQKEQFNEIYQYAEEKLGPDQLLINGNYHDYIYRNAAGHPFLFENEYTINDILFHDKEYKNVSTKYDIYEQSLILLSWQGNSPITTFLATEFLSEFTKETMYFKKYIFNGRAPGFYQVVAKTKEITCLYYWYKTRQKSRHNGTFSTFKFSETKHKTYLLINNNLLRYNNNKSFTHLFPEQIQKELILYLKSNNLRLKEVSDDEMFDILMYSKTLLKQHNIQLR